MSRPEPTTTAREELREQLLAAARREEAKPEAVAKRRRRRRQRRGLGLGVAVLLGGAVAATATDLISTGEPVRDSGFSGEQYRPAVPGAPDLVAQAKDPDGKTTWGVGVYTSVNNLSCAIAGRVRGNQLGTLRDGTFRPYRADSRGACTKLGRRPIILDTLNVGGAQPRTIIFGRTRPGEPYVLADYDGKTHRVATARGGGFILVFEGRVSDAVVNPRLPDD